MKKNPPFAFLFVLLLFTGYSCNTVYQSQSLQYKSYRITEGEKKDSAVLAFLRPYSNALNTMKYDVVCVVDFDME